MRGGHSVFWVTLGLASACGESAHHDSPAGAAGHGGDTAGASAQSGTGGAGGMTEPRCTDMVDDGAPLTPRCPSTDTCPTAPDCTRCEDCADQAGIGAPLVDGTYELKDVILYNSACGSFNGTTASGVLVVAGGALTLAWTRPIALGATAAGTASYDFHTDGNELVLTETCPARSEATRVGYATANGVIYLESTLPGQVAFSAVFAQR